MKKILLSVALVCMSVIAMAQKPAMLKLSTPSTTEQTAVDWFKTSVNGDVLSIDDLAGLKVSANPCLWIMVDRCGLANGATNLPDGLDAQAKNYIEAYVKAGGNLLLTNHATQLVNSIERCSYSPTIFGSGNGGDNGDIWGSQAVIGNVEGQIYDHQSHAIYKDLSINSEAYGHNIFPFIGAGFKYDHNCMWDMNAIGDVTENPNKIKDFENKTSSVVLGTWNHVVDYCCAGIVEFLPTTDYKGTVLCVGLAAYDWGQPDTDANLKKFSKNMIDYLCSLTTGVQSVSVAAPTAKSETYNLAGQRVNASQKGIVIMSGKKFVK